MKSNKQMSVNIEDVIKQIIITCLILYCILGIHKLNDDMIKNFDNIYVRLVLIALIILTALYEPIICLLLAISFVLTHQHIQNLKKNNLDNLNQNNVFNLLENDHNHANQNHDNHSNNYVNDTPVEVLQNNLDPNHLNLNILNDDNNVVENNVVENNVVENNVVENNVPLNVNNVYASNELENNLLNNNSLTNNSNIILLESSVNDIDKEFNYMSPNQVNDAVLNTNKFFYSEKVLEDMSSNYVPGCDQLSSVQSQRNSMGAQGL